MVALFSLDITVAMPGKGRINDGYTEGTGGHPRVQAGDPLASRRCRADGGVCGALAAAPHPHGRIAGNAAGAARHTLRDTSHGDGTGQERHSSGPLHVFYGQIARYLVQW